MSAKSEDKRKMLIEKLARATLAGADVHQHIQQMADLALTVAIADTRLHNPQSP